MSSSRFEVERVTGDENVVKEKPNKAVMSNQDETTNLLQKSESANTTPIEDIKKGETENSDCANITSPNGDQKHEIANMQKSECASKASSNEDLKKDEFIIMNKVPKEGDTEDVDKLTSSGDSNVVEGKEAGTSDGAKKSRFHVEFVNPVKNLSPDSQSDTHDSHTKTYYLRTFGHNTTDAIPMVAYYRNSASVAEKSKRPTLDQLHEAPCDVDSSPKPKVNDDVESTDMEAYASSIPIKFGWIKGVLIRCVLNIWGVMLFLRLSWIVGQAGIGITLLIILLSSCVTSITTLSMSAICTNGQVRGGGAYYLISRSLGPEFGGAIGLIFSAANAIGVSLYVVGFSETVVELMTTYNASITGDEVHDVRVIGTITVLLLLAITQLGMAWEAKMQIVLLFILLIAILNFLIGTFIPADQYKMSHGYFSYQTSVAAENFGPDFRNGHGFFSLFSIFFPAATGILAGCNISGDLKDAQTAIPKGTLLAIAITSTVYGIIAIILGFTEVRVASGNETDYIGVMNVSALNCTTAACQFGWNYMSRAENCTDSADADIHERCYSSGLLNDYQAMQKISFFSPIILAGIFAATLSSALASLVSAPKVFQAVCRDKLFPYIWVFGIGSKKTDEPRYGYILAFAIALAFILIGQLNAIAPIISNFFLASYTLINYSCFSASLAKSPGWRPSFKYYNMWLSLFGAVVCLAIMFVIQWWAALITIVIVLALYKYVDYKKPDVNWGSSTQAYIYTQALNLNLKLQSVDDHVKNYRPQILALTGPPNHRPALAHFASQITKNVSMMACANVKITNDNRHLRSLSDERKKHQTWFHTQHIKSFYSSCASSSLTDGILTMMQLSGLGKMCANTLLMGFKSDWRDVSGKYVTDYINIIHHAFDMNYSVSILRMKEGLDVSCYLSESDDAPKIPSSKSNSSLIKKESSFDSSEVILKDKLKHQVDEHGSSAKLVHLAADVNKENNSAVDAATIKAATQFQTVQKKGKTIDVWWMFDDGGLTLLLPYLLSTRKQWSGCRLRIFTGGKQERIDQDKRTMARLLSKFRIDFEDVTVIGDVNAKPQKESIANFQKMIEPYCLFDETKPSEMASQEVSEPWKITDNELATHKEKTNRQIRLQELLQKHSKDAALIMMTLPIARKGVCSSSLYMAWLEELSRDLPPIVLVRGNQTNVLTFYS